MQNRDRSEGKELWRLAFFGGLLLICPTSSALAQEPGRIIFDAVGAASARGWVANCPGRVSIASSKHQKYKHNLGVYDGYQASNPELYRISQAELNKVKNLWTCDFFVGGIKSGKIGNEYVRVR